MKRRSFFSRASWSAFWVSCALVETVYFLTLAPSVTLEDSGELIAAAAHFGVPHPPGYPLWTFLNWLFINLFPFGNLAWRANLCSSLFGALACGVIGLISSSLAEKICEAPTLKKNLPGSMPVHFLVFAAGCVAGLSLGFVESLWFQSVITEVYSINAFFFAVILLFMYRWLHEPNSMLWACLTFCAYGVGLTNHQTLTMFAPALIIFVAFVNWKLLRDLLPYVLFAGSTMAWATQSKLAIVVTAVLYCAYIAMTLYTCWDELDARRILFLGICYLLPIAGAYLFAECVNDLSPLSHLENLVPLRWAAVLLGFVVVMQLLASFFGRVEMLVACLVTVGFGVCLGAQTDYKEYLIAATVVIAGVYGWLLLEPKWKKWTALDTFHTAACLVLPLAGGFLVAICAGGPLDFPRGDLQLVFPFQHFTNKQWILCSVALLIPVLAVLVLLSLRQSLQFWHGRRSMLLVLAGVVGVSVYVYLPLAANTNPPMNWSYTGTMSGFVHSVTRGQYDPIGSRPFTLQEGIKFFRQIEFYYTNLVQDYTFPIGLLGVLALIGFFEINYREKKYCAMLLVAWICLALLLTYMLNTTFEEQTLFINRVFYSTSHMIFSIWLGIGLVVLVAFVNQIRTIESWVLAFVFLLVLALLAAGFKSEWIIYPVVLAGIFAFVIGLWASFRFPSLRYGAFVLPMFLPVMILVNNLIVTDQRPWLSEQRGHDYGWRYGYDMMKNMDRDAILFGGTDPGRFVPTYMIFVESFAKPSERYFKGRDFDRRDLYIITQNALADSTYMDYIRDQYTDRRPKEYNAFERWLGRDKAYPARTIYIPDEDRYNQLFMEVCDELGRKPGSGIVMSQDERGNARMGAEGVAAIFAINGAVAREIFEKNKNEHTFYVEESFPLDWMYPYLEPFGLIMKLNKEPLAKLSPEVVKKDFEFWGKYTRELLADPKFMRDIVARRAFAKLRASIGGLYAVRGMKLEAERAFLQAVSLFEGSSEGCSRLMELYIKQERYDEALLIALGWQAVDPGNETVKQVINQVALLQQIEANRVPLALKFQANSADKDTYLELAASLAQLQKLDDLDTVVKRYLKNKDLDSQTLLRTVNLYGNFGIIGRLVHVLSAEAQQQPRKYELWYTLAVAQALAQQNADAAASLKKAFQLNPNLKRYASEDVRLEGFRGTKEYQDLVR